MSVGDVYEVNVVEDEPPGGLRWFHVSFKRQGLGWTAKIATEVGVIINSDERPVPMRHRGACVTDTVPPGAGPGRYGIWVRADVLAPSMGTAVDYAAAVFEPAIDLVAIQAAKRAEADRA